MFAPFTKKEDPASDSARLNDVLRSLITGHADPDLANAAALLWWYLDEVNWVGFYLARVVGEREKLILGPFQGLPACVAIPFGKGVCGDAAARRRTIVVSDVFEYPGHIACDAASRSEIVVPLVAGERLIGVLDVDSPRIGRFGSGERACLEAFVRTLLENWTPA